MTRPPDVEHSTAFRIRNALLTITRCWPHMLPDGPNAASAGTIGRHASESRPPVPLGVLDVRRVALEYLGSWSLVVIDDRDLTCSIDGKNAPQMANLLSTHADWLAEHEAAEDALAELEDTARRCQSIAEPHAALKFAGTCDVCGDDLMGDGRTARCKGCKQVVDAETQRLKVADAVRDRLLTAAEIVTLSPSLGHRVGHTQVNRWAARGLLAHRGVNPRGQALYSAAEVCDLIQQRFGQQESA